MIGLGWALRAPWRTRFIARYAFPAELRADLGAPPEVPQGLRDWLIVCHQAALADLVTLPSAAVAEAWRRFSETASYASFSRRAFGQRLLPAAVSDIEPALRAEGVKRTWNVVCSLEHIEPREPERLPRLFALDEAVGHAPAIAGSWSAGSRPSGG